MGSLALVIQIYNCLYKKKRIQFIKVKNIYKKRAVIENQKYQKYSKNLMGNIVSKIFKTSDDVDKRRRYQKDVKRKQWIEIKEYFFIIRINHNGPL